MQKRFDDLAKAIKKNYEHRGYSKKEATRIGYATANKILKHK